MFRDICLTVFLGTLGFVLIEAQVTCSYNGVNYREGSSWLVNCTSKCTCNSMVSGSHISCKSPCMDFSTLPNGCGLQPAPIGMCCPQPICPPSMHMTFQIPPEYSHEYPTIVG